MKKSANKFIINEKYKRFSGIHTILVVYTDKTKTTFKCKNELNYYWHTFKNTTLIEEIN
jgi:hypothetical protein